MSDLITLITCTGGRPEAFHLCYEYVQRQTYTGPKQWIVVDDSHALIDYPPEIELLPGPRKWEPGLNTQRFNMELALTKVKGKYVFIVEDDDYYTPTYIQTYLDLLKTVHIVGEGNARYYHVEIPGHKQLQNNSHSALSQTAFRSTTVLPLLQKAVNSGHLYFDSVLWTYAIEMGLARCLLYNSGLSFGMKGLPGRTGIGIGHKKKDYLYDAGHATLNKWLGPDAELYKGFLKGASSAKNSQRPQSNVGAQETVRLQKG